MLLGYNHNIPYKGSIFHIQTEDSGVKNPHIITLLYREGVILCSQKTSYMDIIKIDNLESVVEDLMKEQHKDMLRRLKNGEFDEKAFIGTTQQANEDKPEKKEETKPSVAPSEAPAHKTAKEPDSTGIGLLFQETVQKPELKTPDSIQSPKEAANIPEAASLDDAILNFFGAAPKK